MKKTLCLTLSFMLLFAHISAMAFILNESFEGYPKDESLPSESGWTQSGTDSDARVVVDPKNPNEKCVYFEKSGSGGDASFSKGFGPLSGQVVVELRALVTEKKYRQLPTISGTPEGGSNEVSVARMHYNAGGSYAVDKHDSTTTASYENDLDKWVKWKYIIDTDTDTFDVYKNGTKLHSNLNANNKVSDITNISFSVSAGGIYIDDVRVYKYISEPIAMDFEKNNIGDAWTDAGWVLSDNTTKPESQYKVVADPANPSEKSLLLMQSGEGKGQITYTKNISPAFKSSAENGKVIVEFSIYTEEKNIIRILIRDSANNGVVDFQYGTSGKILFDSVESGYTYATGVWETYTFICDTNSHTMDVKRISEGVTTVMATGRSFQHTVCNEIEKIQIQQQGHAVLNQAMYFDNVNVYMENNPIIAGATVSPAPTSTPIVSGTMVELTTSETNGTIYYTMDGTVPTNASNKYTGAFQIKDTCVLKTVVIKNGMESTIKSYAYTVVGFNDMEILNDSFTVGDKEIYNLSQLKGGDTLQRNVKIKNDGATCAAVLILALYNGDKLEKVEYTSVTLTNGENDKNITLVMPTGEVSAYTIKSFLWGSIEDANPWSSARILN